jgi:hypothetical protein
MLTDELLTDYAGKFFGYGNWSAKVWFIGIEEAGGKTESEIKQRLHIWHKRGRLELENVREFYTALDNDHNWHGENADLQPTWAGLIRLLLLARGEEDSDQIILQYQRSQMGEICVAELLALPSPDTRTWNYAGWTDVDWLQSRVGCFDKTTPGRILTFKQRIQASKPKAVIFYGTTIPERSLLPLWSNLAGGQFNQGFEDDKILLCRQTGDTAFFVTRHPTIETIQNLRRIGQYFREHHADKFQRPPPGARTLE